MIFRKIENFIFLSLIIILLFSFINCSNIAAGSYPYAELYELDYPESKVLEAIKTIKTKNPVLKAGKDLVDTDSSDNWHHEWFRLDNQIIMTWIQSSETNRTTFALVSVGNPGNWSDINKDLSNTEDLQIKEKFCKSILNKVKEELQNSNSLQH